MFATLLVSYRWLVFRYNQVCELMAKMVKRADKLTEATRRRLAGYQRRAAGLAQSTAEAVRAAQEKDTELACFEHLDHLEQGARRDRVTAAELKLKEEVCECPITAFTKHRLNSLW